jgi:hypothetical protein
MDGADKSSQNLTHAGFCDEPIERGRRKITWRRITAPDERRNVNMTNEIEQQVTLTAVEGSPAPLTEQEISRLKGLLEEKLARSHMRARWAGMVEDCEILLSHLESRTR